MQCQERMDRASAKLSRARSALRVATKAGMEATRGELLDMIAAALESIDDADSVLQDEESERRAAPANQRESLAPTPFTLELVQSHPRVVSLACASSAS